MAGDTILSPVYRIFSQEVNGKTFTVSLVDGETLYTIRQGFSVTEVDTLNDFLAAAVDELGGTVKRNGTVSEDTLEHFGKDIGTVTAEKEKGNGDMLGRVVGAGVQGKFEANFGDDDIASGLFKDFIDDLIGKDPAMSEIYSFGGGTNGGANSIKVLANEEIIGLNDVFFAPFDGVGTQDSLLFAWSGADTQGTQTTNNLDIFVEAMGDLFGGTQIKDAALLNLDGGQDTAQGGPQDKFVQIEDPRLFIPDAKEIWRFADEASATAFKTVVDDVFTAIGDVAPV
jgi:hypothetical protein